MPLDKLSENFVTLCSLTDDTEGVLGTVTSTNCLEAQKLQTNSLYELVKIEVTSGMELVASMSSMVWKYIERNGFFKTEIRLCRIGDSVGCYGRDAYLQRHKIIEISHIWEKAAVYPVLSMEPYNSIVNGFLVGLFPDRRQTSKKPTSEVTGEG